MTATEAGHSGASRSAFSRRNPGASSRWPKSRLLNSRCPCPSPVTMSRCGQRLHLCTGAPLRFAPLHGLLPPRPTGPLINQSTLHRSAFKQPPPLNPTPPQQPQPFRMPGKAKGQPDNDKRQPRREGQGNSDQSRDDQDRSRDHSGRLDNAEHAYKVSVSSTAQLPPPPEPPGLPPETVNHPRYSKFSH